MPEVLASEGPTTSPPAARRLKDVGILFVHGIGEQPRGDTLYSFGDPLINVMDRWLKGPPEREPSPGKDAQRGSVRVVDAELSPDGVSDGQAAYAELEVVVHPRPGEVTSSSWLLQESWWAKEIHAPSPSKLAAWMLRMAPWILLSHGMRRWFQVEIEKGWRAKLKGRLLQTYRLLLFIPLIPLSVVVQLLIILLAVLAWVPIRLVRSAATALLRRMPGLVGDSYVLVQSPSQERAAVRAVRDSIEALAQEAARVVVIAHSQGAHIAYQALLDNRPSNVKRFVTFGAGISKLHDLKQSTADWSSLGLAIAVPFALLSALLLPRTLAILPEGFPPEFAVFLPFLVGAGAVFPLWFHVRRTAQHEWRQLGIPWTDLYASMDPVPNGPLLLSNEGVGLLRSYEVINQGNIFNDHTSYWENRQDFVMRILGEISEATGVPVAPPLVTALSFDGPDWFPDAREDIQKAIKIREVEVGVLAASRGLAGVGLLIIFLAATQWADAGRALVERLDANVFTAPLASAFAGTAGLVSDAGRWLGVTETTASALGYGGVVVTALALVLYLWHRFCVTPTWRALDERSFRWLCNPATRPKNFLDRFWPSVALFLFIAAELYFAFTVWSDPGAERLTRMFREEVPDFVGVAPLVTYGLVLLIGLLAAAVGFVSVMGKKVRKFMDARQLKTHAKATSVDSEPTSGQSGPSRRP